jgi:hypothetical protein
LLGVVKTISRKAAEDASTPANCSKVWPSLPRPVSGTFDQAKSGAKFLSRCLDLPASGDEATSDREQVAVPLSSSYSSHAIAAMAVTHESKSIRRLPQQRQVGADSYQVQSERRLRKQRPRNLRRRAPIRQFKMGPQNRKMYVTTSVPHASPRLAWHIHSTFLT